jgi:hypothetical protein
MSSNRQLQQEMAEIQREIESYLHTLLSEVESKLEPQERASIKEEFRWLNELLERLKSDSMYEDVDPLVQVMNVLDQANRARDQGNSIKRKIFEVREKEARRVIITFGTASVGGADMPLSTLIVTPGILASMVYVLFRVMGKKDTNKKEAAKISVELLKECEKFLTADFVAVASAEIVVSSVHLLGPLSFLIGLAADVLGLSYFRYRRMVILGEVTLEFIRNDCSWGGEDAQALIRRAKERALQNYIHLKTSWKDREEPTVA